MKHLPYLGVVLVLGVLWLLAQPGPLSSQSPLNMLPVVLPGLALYAVVHALSKRRK